MKPIKELVRAILDDDGQHYEESGEVISLDTRGENCFMNVKILCDDEHQLMSVLASVELIVPPDRKKAVLQVINMLNANSMFGRFSLAESNRGVWCCCSSHTDDGALNREVATVMIATVVGLLDDAYLPLVSARLGVLPERNNPPSAGDAADA